MDKMSHYGYRNVDRQRLWFPFIHRDDQPEKSLLKYLADRRSTPLGHIVIYYEYQPDKYVYTLFDNIVELSDYLMAYIWQYGEHNAHFGEVIFSVMPQKIRYDIDIKDPNAFELFDDCVTEVIEATEYVLAKHGTAASRLHDIIVTTSHGPHKRSGHIIVDGLCHDHQGEAKHFNGLVMEHISSHLKPYIDQGVYKSIQNFRMLLSCKNGDSRIKVLSPWRCGDSHIIWQPSPKMMEQYPKIQDLHFASTLISVTDHCTKLPNFGYRPPVRHSIVIDLDDYIMKHVHALVQALNHEELVWAIDRIQGNKIELKRLRPSMCISCKRVHDSQNACIIITKDAFIQAWFNCYQRLRDTPMVETFMIPSPDGVTDHDYKFEVGDIPVVVYHEEVKPRTADMFETVRSTISQPRKPLGHIAITTVSNNISTAPVAVPAITTPAVLSVPLVPTPSVPPRVTVDYSQQSSMGCPDIYHHVVDVMSITQPWHQPQMPYHGITAVATHPVTVEPSLPQPVAALPKTVINLRSLNKGNIDRTAAVKAARRKRGRHTNAVECADGTTLSVATGRVSTGEKILIK